MGHDISAYIKTKSNPNPNWENGKEVAYFRIGAFNTLRKRLFYGIIPNSEGANAGVSGDGSTLDYSREDIVSAINACKYFMEDDDALREVILSQEQRSDAASKEFRDLIEGVFGKIETSSTDVEESPIDDIREGVAQVWKFCEDILSEYDDVKKTDDSAGIQIYFG